MKTKFQFRRSVALASLFVGFGVLASCGGAAPTPTTTTTTNLHAQPEAAIWPYYASGVRYVTPTAAASTFVTHYLKMSSPIQMSVAAGTNHATVDFQFTTGGPVTAVSLSRLMGDGTWWVIGASTAHITVSSPVDRAQLSSPITVRGRSVAFEAVVNVIVRVDGQNLPLLQTTVMGGAVAIAPFNSSISLPSTTARAGAIIFETLSAKDGSVAEATVVRVKF